MIQICLASRERVNRMFEREDHDRIPRHDAYWPETIGRWQREGVRGGSETVYELLESDFHCLCSAAPVPFPGRHEIIEEDVHTHVIRNGWGAALRTWKDRSGAPEHLGFECISRSLWETQFKPALIDSGVQIDVEAVRQNYAAGREQDKWCYLSGLETFEATRRLMGDEITLRAMAEEPDWIRDISHTYTEMVLRDLTAVIAAGIRPDGLWIYGDMAYRRSTVCSPAMYRELVWSDHLRMADWAHDHGMRVIFHTDGNVTGVLNDYIEAGFDCLQPLEAKAGMDIRQLCPEYGDRLATFGNVNVMVMKTNDLEKIEAEVFSKLQAGMSTGAYAYHSDHSVPPQVSWDTYQFIIELLDRYGNYE